MLWRDLFCIVRNYLKYSVSQRDEIKEISERDAHTQKKDESTHVATRRMDPCLAHRDRARPTARMRRDRVDGAQELAPERVSTVAHGAGKVSGEPDPIRALLVVIASSDGFAQAQRTPSRKSLRDFSPPSPMAALQL